MTEPTRPTTDGGVWGSYVNYLAELEAAAARLTAELAEARTELGHWQSGRRTKGLPTVESVPDALHYAAELVRAQGTEGGEDHDRLLVAAGMRLKAIHDAAAHLLREAIVNRAELAEARAGRRITERSPHPCPGCHPDNPDLRCIYPDGHVVHWDGARDIWLSPTVADDMALASAHAEGIREGWGQAVAALGHNPAVADVLVQHTRTDIKGCSCGWADLGRRWSRHVVLYMGDALASLTPAKPGDTPGELVPGEADTPQPVDATFNPAYRNARCGQLSTHAPHVVEHGPDQPRNCPGT